MKPWPLLVLGVVALLPIACQEGKFTEDKATDSYEIKVVDPNGADATATATVEDGSGSDSNSSVTTPEGDDSKTDSGASGKGSDKGSEKGSDKGSGKGGDADAGACAAVAGLNKDRVKVNGSQKTVTLSPQDAFALKVSGNANQVNLKMSADAPGARLSAICLFLNGNQSHVTMDIGVAVGRIFIKARGNKALVEAAVSKDGGIENLQVDASGNQPRIVMRGEGKYPCDQIDTSVSCEKP